MAFAQGVFAVHRLLYLLLSGLSFMAFDQCAYDCQLLYIITATVRIIL